MISPPLLSGLASTLGRMKRREVRERDEAAAREQSERRTESLLAPLKAREAAASERTEEGAPAATSTEPESPEPKPATELPS